MNDLLATLDADIAALFAPAPAPVLITASDLLTVAAFDAAVIALLAQPRPAG